MVQAQATCPKAQVWTNALVRATRDRIVVYRVSPTTLGVATVANGWTEKPYTIAILGERACEVSCDCPGARNGRTCKHHVYARQPISPSTAAEVAQTEATKREVLATLIAGVAPSLGDMF